MTKNLKWILSIFVVILIIYLLFFKFYLLKQINEKYLTDTMSSAESSLNTYANKDLGFEIKYPKDKNWGVDEITEKGVITIYRHGEQSGDLVAVESSSSISAVNNKGKTIDQIARDFLKEDYPGYSIKSIKIGENLDAKYYESKKGDMVNNILRLIYYQKNQKTYQFLISSQKWQRDKSEIEKILQSFKVI